jgi:hypothetical protein
MDTILFGAPLSCFPAHLGTYQLLDLMTFTDAPFHLDVSIRNDRLLNAICHLSAHWMFKKILEPRDVKLRALFLSKTALLAMTFLAHSQSEEHKHFAADALRLAVLLQVQFSSFVSGHACSHDSGV